MADEAARAHKRRRAAYGRGRRAEWLAAWWLRLQGYRILARGWRSPLGEIDLVAARGGILAFVEVKRRAEEAAALRAVSAKQRARIERAARGFLQRHPELSGHACRFDALLLLPGRLPRHLPDAWRLRE